MTPKKTVELIRKNKGSLKALADLEVDRVHLNVIASEYCRIMNMASANLVGLVYNSCLHLLYTVPDEETIIENFRRIAINNDYIWKGFTIPTWHGEPVNVTLGIIRATESTYKTTKYTTAVFRVLTGLPAGSLMAIKLPSWWVVKIIKRKLGMWRTHLKISPVDIAGTSFNARIYMKDDGSIVWDNIKTAAKQKETNKRLINARYEQRPCGAPVPCCQCRANRSQCPLAVL